MFIPISYLKVHIFNKKSLQKIENNPKFVIFKALERLSGLPSLYTSGSHWEINFLAALCSLKWSETPKKNIP